MDERHFEGTLVLEQLARIDQVEAFMNAVDEENLQAAASLIRRAGVDEATIKIVLRKFEKGGRRALNVINRTVPI